MQRSKNRVTTTFTYRPQRRWPTFIATSGPSGTIQRLNYTDRDAVGRILPVASDRPGEDWTYTYDSLDQLLVHRYRFAHLCGERQHDLKFSLGAFIYPAATSSSRL